MVPSVAIGTLLNRLALELSVHPTVRFARSIFALLLVAAIGLMPTSAVDAQEADWPQWRGVQRDGKAPDTGLIDSWGDDGPPLLWSTEGAGGGFSSISVTGGRIFTMGDHDDEQYVVAFDDATGERLWMTAIGPAWEDEYGGPRATPTVVDDVAYAIGTEGDLVALDVATGEIRWHLNMQTDLNGSTPLAGNGWTWKYAESPLVDGDRVVVTPGGESSFIAALDRHTGEVEWSSAVPEFGEEGVPGAGYSSAVISEGAGVRQYVQLMGNGIVGVEAATGRVLWTYSRMANPVANIPTPVIDGDYVLTATGYGSGAALLQLVADGDGVRAEEVWFNEAGTMQNHHGGMVIHDGTIYLGQGHNRGFPQAVDFMSGEVLWGPERNDGDGSGSVLYADGHLYYRYQNGVMVLAEATRDGYVEKGSFTIPNPAQFSWAHLVIADGRLYVREQDAIYVYDVRAN
ncbi:MAG: PQQ-binding-like beta-propeller repeat protein [Acidobacteria bacterium]|nr:PQQ-binding-like beta-propeller repeat protein [Acidobacteriota bacterium]